MLYCPKVGANPLESGRAKKHMGLWEIEQRFEDHGRYKSRPIIQTLQHPTGSPPTPAACDTASDPFIQTDKSFTPRQSRKCIPAFHSSRKASIPAPKKNEASDDGGVTLEQIQEAKKASTSTLPKKNGLDSVSAARIERAWLEKSARTQNPYARLSNSEPNIF